MDVQIVGENTNSILNSDLPEKRIKRDHPLKPVDSCSEVTSKLNLSLSLSQPAISGKARTVCSTGSLLPKPSHSFDFRFVANDNEVRHLLSAQTHDEKRDVVIISHPDDLSQANLVSRLSISGGGCHSLQPGKLFEADQPLTLVIDIRKLTSEDLPKLNDLLDPDNPCLYDRVSQKKRPLGEDVALLVVAEPGQLASVGKSDEAPGADFWRRIHRPGNTWQFDVLADNGQSMDISDVSPVLAEFPYAEGGIDEEDIDLIDCHLHSNWRQLLLGGPGVDKQGRIQHIPGKLEQLKAGQRVILKGANWHDLAFEQTIRQLIAQKRYESNGVVCHLPGNVQFYQMPLGDDELRSLFQTMTRSGDKAGDKECDKALARNTPQNPLIINQSNIKEWLTPICIAREGYAVPNTSLLEQVQSGAVVTVTSPLSESLWFCLLGALQNIHKVTGVKPQLQVAHVLKQPKSLGLEENDACPLPNTFQLQEQTGDHASINTVTYQQHTQADQWISSQQEAPLVIRVNEQTSFSQLFDNIHITSEKDAHFGHLQSEAQVALMRGRRVVFRGLESNPKLQQLLEPLVCGQPLLVNGKLQAYPDARITILWPEPAKSPSSVWRSMIAAGEPCPEVDIWDINAVKHGIPRDELPEQVLNELYNAFKTVPANRGNPLPEMTKGLLNNLILAARQAQKVDHAPQLQPCHWRKAINSVLTHGTRQTPSVRDFMKVACWQLLPDTEHTAWVDPDGLNAVINSAQRLDRHFVMQNVWKLARAFGPAVFANTEFKQLNLSYERPDRSFRNREFSDSLCALIVAQVPQAQQGSVAFQLDVDPLEAKQYQQLSIRPLNQIKRLEDALASGWQLRCQPAQTRSDAIHSLAADCFGISRGEWVTENREAECIQRIEHRLSQSLEWKGCSEAPFSMLAHDLCYGSFNQKDRELRRLSRLHDRLVDSPAIFLQGKTGTGKSYFSANMARASSGWASLISLGPSDSEQTLMKRWQWQERGDGDRFMAQQNRMLMEWANTQPDTDGHYVTLVLDEANLAKPGLLASLNGLWEPEPCIYVNGHPVKVSTQHRVILTGNPDHYAGRRLDPELKEKLPRAYYPPLNRAFLRDRVVEPALLRLLQRHLPEQQSGDIARSATNSVMALWQYYPECLPEHEFTPRDLTDICSWVGWYLDRALPDTYTGGSVSIEQMNGLVLQSFRDVLGAEVPDTHQDARASLECWFSARFPVGRTLSDRVHNQTLVDIQQAFIKVTAQTRPEFDTSGSAVSELVQQLGQDLSRCQQAYHHGRKHGGRQATLIEGPAGRGKDVTLKLLIESIKQQTEQRGESMPEVFYRNACDCSWEELCAVIQKANIDGGIVVISEMNLIDQHLEGELNDILAGDAHPGFHLFATTNPPEYSGRKPLSPALKGRFRHLPIRQYNPTELQTIVEKVLPQTPQGKFTAELLTHWHCRLRASLQQQNLPLQPSSLDLQNVARAVINDGDFTENSLRQHIHQYYQLYLMAAKTSLEKLPELSAMTIGEGGVDRALCDWFYCTVPGIDRPWLIRRSYLNSLDEKRHEILIKADLSEAEARMEIIRMVARAQWQASGHSLKPDDTNDTLTQALYRHWQHCWFEQGFGQAGVDANTVFALTDAQEQTLKMSANQPYLREANKRISTWDSSDVILWPAFWQTMSRIVLNPVSQYSRSENEVTAQDLPADNEVTAQDLPADNEVTAQDLPADNEVTAQDLPADSTDENRARLPLDKQAVLPAETIRPLDRKTDYEQEEGLPLSEETKIFNNDTDPGMYRLKVYDVTLDNQGNVEERRLGHGEYGLEAVFPATLPEGEITLARGQSLGVDHLYVRKNQYYYLPSLNPDETIPALRITPSINYQLIKDQYTGLHMVSFPDATETQKITIHYVVEKRQTTHPCKKTAGDTRPDCTVTDSMELQLAEFFNDFETSAMPENQKEQIRDIQSAETQEDRIDAIARYCRDFKGADKHESVGGFFRFLLWHRQGACRHRTPLFVAFCRYFAIPARTVKNEVHAYPEYSLDGGISWQSKDLGGAPRQITKIEPAFQPSILGSGSSTESKRVKDLLKGATPEQQQRLAKVYDLSLEALRKTLEAGCALPKTDLSTSKVVRKLWEGKDLTGLSMGVSMLESLETLDYDERQLIGDVYYDGYDTYKPMSAAVKQILSSSGEDQMIQSLKSLHSKMIVQGEACPHNWLSSMVDVLRGSNLAHPQVIHFAHETFESGWLDPLSTHYYSYIMNAYEHHDLLVSLEGVNELKTKAGSCLKKWYQELLSREKNSQEWRRAYQRRQEKKSDSFFVTHSHDGVSPFLEEKIASTSLQTSWTDEPEGVPDIERMLVHNPAFPQLISGKNNHRPVIIVGQPSWYNTVLEVVKAEALFQQKLESSSELKKLSERVNKHDEMKEKYNNELPALPRPNLPRPNHRRDFYEYKKRRRNLGLAHDADADAREAIFERKMHSSMDSDDMWGQRRVPQSDGRYQAEKEEYDKKCQEIKSRYTPILKSLEVSLKDRERLRELKNKCKQAIQQAFSHYLYQVTHSNGGRLTYCWVDATFGYGRNDGAHDPSSPEELYAMMSQIKSNSVVEKSLKDNYLRQAHNASNALVLKSDELTKIYREFLCSVNLSSINDSLVT